MAQKSHGSRHGTRKKFAKDGDSTLTVNDRKKEFEKGERVLIDYHPSVQDGRCHSRFHGLHGTVRGYQGDSCDVEVIDGGKTKKLFLKPVHLSEVED